MSRRLSFLAASHFLVACLGFGLGVYLLPILTAPADPPADAVMTAINDATYHAAFKRDLPGSDRLHWAEGSVGVGQKTIAFSGEMAPGPDYKVYLTRDYVDTIDGFLKVKAQARRVGEARSFKRLLIDVPPDVNVKDYTTVVVWCETFSKFISAAQYRDPER
ncbi:DM13 domain-containing protein [Stenotrophomonas sp. CFBP 13725]|uniref:DM13 domain-containing protein n=1 Tax=Stenotrophomonas sp. CFBP 13725 TaxID=2775297 RepID=UPI001783FF82|nr:DM13 domain-containing protein [Stenotrophomonas sp. CFBP 13725]MBD8635996.1 DM13 domain-containing protein [Stenotrophomonas sp. CFBP 13725]